MLRNLVIGLVMQILMLFFMPKLSNFHFHNFVHNKVLIEVAIASLTLFNFDAFALQKLAKFLNLFFEFTDELSVGVFIDDGLAHNLLGPVGISEWKTSRNYFNWR